MLEKALSGDKRYWGWMGLLAALVLVGAYFYSQQLKFGLGITGLSRDVSWGFYIAQFTFLVGVAASAVMVVLPYYLHNFKLFGKVTILGEFLAISAVTMCLLFIVVDLGQPQRMLNMILHPTPHSILFWDMVVLNGYLLLNLIISWTVMRADKRGTPPPAWLKPVIYLSIPWAVSIHTVTAFIYCGLAGRPFWMTAILAPRFLASAFASGPALLIILCLLVRKFTKYDPGLETIFKVAEIVTYAMAVNIFFVLVEIFTALYSAIPEHVQHFSYLFVEGRLSPWMWTSITLAVAAFIVLIFPASRRNVPSLVGACIAVFVSIWIEKGLGMVVTGFIPNPMGRTVEYWPTVPELLITVGVYALGAMILTALFKIGTAVKLEAAGEG